MAGRQYIIKSGDTLGKLAKKFNVDVDELALRNGIKDSNYLDVGQIIRIGEDDGVHVVQRNETLSSIADAENVTVEAILAANPKIRNRNLIFEGQRIVIPGGAGHPEPAPVEPPPVEAPPSGAQGDLLSLTDQDVVDIKKTLQTEWVQSAGEEQAAGIVDTILNRLASEHWGSSIADVVNARNQFSDVNGPVSRKAGRHSVDEIDISRVSKRVSDFVDAHLTSRAGGTPSRVDSHLNYANPHFSDAKNLAWIMALDGPVLGRGNAIHRHGTVPELQRFRPKSFRVSLPGDLAAVASAPANGGTIDGHQVAKDHGVGVKSGDVEIAKLHPAMAAVIVAVAKAAEELGLPEPMITSGNDGKHGKNSLHYANRALDFRGRNISVAQGNALDSAVSTILGPSYDVIFETFKDPNNNHLHVEYDPR